LQTVFLRISIDISKTIPANTPRFCVYGGHFKKVYSVVFEGNPKFHGHGDLALTGQMVRKLFFEESPLNFQKPHQHTGHDPAHLAAPLKKFAA
jgi:hypothetical protein